MLIKKGTLRGINVVNVTLNGEPFDIGLTEYLKTGPNGWIQAFVRHPDGGHRIVIDHDMERPVRKTFRGDVRATFAAGFDPHGRNASGRNPHHVLKRGFRAGFN